MEFNRGHANESLEPQQISGKRGARASGGGGDLRIFNLVPAVATGKLKLVLRGGELMWPGLPGGALTGARDGVSKLLASSCGFMGAIGSKIKTFIEPLPPEEEKTDSDGDARQKQELRSRRILLHLLARTDRFSEVLAIAEATTTREEAVWAVQELVAQKPHGMDQYLVYLGKGDSYATIPAISALFNEKFFDHMLPLFSTRLRNGDFLRLISEGTVNPFSVLDLLGVLETYGVEVDAVSYFEQIWNLISNYPQEQHDLLAEILGDTSPGGFRYDPEKNKVPAAVKLRAVELLQEQKPPGYLRSLWYGSRCEDDLTSWTATVTLIDHWQTESGKVPFEMEPFSMLETALLFYLCQISASFGWGGPTGVTELHEQLCKDQEEVQTLPTGSARRAGLQDRIERVEQQVAKITQCRVESLQPLVDTITRYMNLPHARLVSDTTDAYAAYMLGFGTVLLSRRVLLDDRPLCEDFMASVLHELLHMEQDVLIIRMIADDLDLKYGQHARLLKSLFEQYHAIMGYAPDSIFLLEVLRRRADRHLTSAERIRAERLADAAVDFSYSAAEIQHISERLERMGASYFLLKDGSYDEYLLECLRDEQGLSSLFQHGHVPGILLEEIRSCREDVKEIVGGAYGAAYKNSDPIELAQEMLASEPDTGLLNIVERLKTVLLQVLNEEWSSLARRNSDLRRAGYHEREAYEISDRVEVIVKAIRKGWYADS